MNFIPQPHRESQVPSERPSFFTSQNLSNVLFFCLFLQRNIVQLYTLKASSHQSLSPTQNVSQAVNTRLLHPKLTQSPRSPQPSVHAMLWHSTPPPPPPHPPLPPLFSFCPRGGDTTVSLDTTCFPSPASEVVDRSERDAVWRTPAVNITDHRLLSPPLHS